MSKVTREGARGSGIVKHWTTMLLSPVVSVALLGGIFWETSRHIKPDDVEPFHARARETIASYPIRVGDWVGVDAPQPDAAVKLLRPNQILSRSYRSTSEADHFASVNLLLVQCKDSRDMLGHYPPVCYPAHGYTEKRREPFDWQVGTLQIGGMEYEFEQRSAQQTYRMVIYNFLIVPGRGVVRDNDAVMRAAEDYQERYYGAAQFQMVMPAELDPRQRKAIFVQMIGARPDIIQTLSSGGIHER